MTTDNHPWRKIAGCVLVAGAIALATSASGQTNADTEILQPGGFYNLSPATKLLRTILWSFGSILLVIAAVVAVLRYRVSPSLYKTASDEQWQEDAQDEAAAQVDESEVSGAMADIDKSAQAENDAEAAAATAGGNQPRLYTPASGPAWHEPMLNAFLASCLKANCLGRAWQEEAAHRQPAPAPSRRLPDPREAELIRKLKARWHEFHVDPEFGVFIDHLADGSGKSRVCLIEVTKEKHAVTRAAFNAGMVIECVGRYLKSSDVVCPSGLGYYHAPNLEERAALSAEEKQRALRLKHIPDPWQAMIGGAVLMLYTNPRPEQNVSV